MGPLQGLCRSPEPWEAWDDTANLVSRYIVLNYLRFSAECSTLFFVGRSTGHVGQPLLEHAACPFRFTK
jgi:hypothetical protein